jgi:hypothetical protein
MQTKLKSILKAGTLLTCFVIAAIAGMMIVSNIQEPIMKQLSVQRQPTLVTGDGDPGAGVSGFFYFMIYPHQAVPATAYASNLSNATAYEFSDVGNASCTGETPSGTTFDIVVKVGVDDSDGENGTVWMDSWTWCLITCADLSIGANTNMTEIQLANTSEYAWYQYYMNNGGAGYTIAEGQAFNVTSVKLYVNRIV